MAAHETLQDLLQWISKEGNTIGIYDATNSTKARRHILKEACEPLGLYVYLRCKPKVMFVESICNDENIILSNIKEVKLSSPDYANMSPEKAVEDFKTRFF